MSVRHPQPSRSRLFAAVLMGLALPAATLAGTAAAQTRDTQQSTDPAPATNVATQTLDKVEVTGSRIKRAQVEGPTPVVVITAEDIRKQGFSTIAEALGTLTQFNGATVAGAAPDNYLSLSVTQPDASFLNLRGMGVGYQLILVNGKRMTEYSASSGAASTGVSIGSIPAAAVARIEVLNAGASAIYGSDAVAGVVNIVTKEGWEGNNLRLRGGTTSRGGGDTFQLQYTGGKSWNRGSLTYAFEQLNRQPIFASQRENIILTGMRAPGNAGTDHPTHGLDVGLMDGDYNDYYWLDQSGNLVYASDVDADTATAALLNTCKIMGGNYFPMYWSSTDTSPGTCGNANYYDGDTLSNRYNKTSGYVAGNYRFTDDVEGYGQLLMQFSRSESAHRSSGYLYNVGSAYDVNIGQFEYWRPLDPHQMGGSPMRLWEQTTVSANVGVRGVIGDRFDWDASVNLSRDEMESSWKQQLEDRVHRYLLGEAIGEIDGAPLYQIDPRVLFGPVRVEDYEKMVDTVRNRNVSQTSQAQFVLTGPVFTLPAGDVEMAAVLEAAHSTYRLGPDPRSLLTYTGADKTFNYTGVAGGGPRDRYGAGVEFRVPLLDSLTANVAGRWDKYDDISSVDDATTWQASLEWRPLDNLLIRASRQTSFMAPNIMWLYGEPVRGYDDFVTNEYLCRVNGLDLTTPGGITRCSSEFRQGSWYLEGGNNTMLHEETSTSTGIGFVWDVFDRLSISADYWEIELEGKSRYLDKSTLLSANADCLLGRRIDGTPVDANSAACALYTAYVERDGAGNVTDFFLGAINEAGVRTKGYDASVKYAFDWEGVGNFNLSLGVSRTLGYDVEVVKGDGWEDRLSCSFSSVYSCGDQPVAFRSGTNLSLTWTHGDWFGSLYGHRNGSRVNFQATDYLPAVVLWNAGLSKKITDDIRIGLDVTNLFDKFGPKDGTMTWYPFYQTAYGIQGRAAYFNIDFSF